MANPPTGATYIPNTDGLKGLKETELWRDPDSKKIYKINSSTPSSSAGETPASSLSPLAGLKVAMRDALNEAGRRRVETNLKTIAPNLEGLPPGSFGSVVELVRGAVKTPVESIFKDVNDTIELDIKQRQDQQKMIQSNVLNLMTDYPDAGILSTDTLENATAKVVKSSSWATKQSRSSGGVGRTGANIPIVTIPSFEDFVEEKTGVAQTPADPKVYKQLQTEYQQTVKDLEAEQVKYTGLTDYQVWQVQKYDSEEDQQELASFYKALGDIGDRLEGYSDSIGVRLLTKDQATQQLTSQFPRIPPAQIKQYVDSWYPS